MSTPSSDHSSKYLYKDFLGRGSFGHVASLQRTDTPALVVAAKIIPIDPNDGDEVQTEVNILAQCNSPFIVRFLESFVDEPEGPRGPELWIVMEYCSRGSLSELVKKCLKKGIVMPEKCIRQICASIVSALKYLHAEKQITHRDVKPGNVLITADGKAKLADFGVSTILSNTLRKCETLVGTSHYVAPEILEESPHYDGKADNWSMGITVIEMAEGEPPHSLNNRKEFVFQKIRTKKAPTLADVDAWHPEMVEFVRLCLEKDPRQRPDSTSLSRHSFVKRYVAALESSNNRLKYLLQFCLALEGMGHTPDADHENELSNEAANLVAQINLGSNGIREEELVRPSTPEVDHENELKHRKLTRLPPIDHGLITMPSKPALRSEDVEGNSTQETAIHDISQRHACPKRHRDHECDRDSEDDNRFSPPCVHRRLRSSPFDEGTSENLLTLPSQFVDVPRGASVLGHAVLIEEQHQMIAQTEQEKSACPAPALAKAASDRPPRVAALQQPRLRTDASSTRTVDLGGGQHVVLQGQEHTSAAILNGTAVERQSAFLTKEEAMQLAVDRKMAERLQNEEYAEQEEEEESWWKAASKRPAAAQSAQPQPQQQVAPTHRGHIVVARSPESPGQGGLVASSMGIETENAALNARINAIADPDDRLKSIGLVCEDADASKYLMILRDTRGYRSPFYLLSYRTQTSDRNIGTPVMDSELNRTSRSEGGSFEGLRAQATIKVQTSHLSTLAYFEEEETRYEDVLELGEADGSFDAVATALKRALIPFLPYLENVESIRFFSDILDSEGVTGADACVTMKFSDSVTGAKYTTRGDDQNLFSAFVKALVDGFEFALVEYAAAYLLHSGKVV